MTEILIDKKEICFTLAKGLPVITKESSLKN